MTVLYVDLSHHDVSRRKGTLPDWKAIREATSPVMCARATYGDPQGYNPASRYFRDLVGGAKRAGFTLLGAYHNLVRGDQASINRQVDYLRREMDAAGANWAMLDVERYEELLSRGLHPRFEDAVRFCERWRAVDKRTITVYLPKWIWDGHMGRPDLRKLGAPLVASNYGSNPDGHPTTVYRARGGDAGVGWNAYGGVTPTIWQYGSDVDCPGASSATDLNAFRGTLADLTRILNPAAAAESEEDDDMDEAGVIKAVQKALTTPLTIPGASGERLAAKGWNKTIAPWTLLGYGMEHFVDGRTLNATDALRVELAALRAEVAAAAGVDPGDVDAIVSGVLAGLGARPAADVVKALQAAGVDMVALRAELAKLDPTGQG